MNNSEGKTQEPVGGMKTKIIIGNNGIPFGVGYKGKGMCASCEYRKKEIANRPGNWLCSYYQSSCRQVSRNCSGIKSFKQQTKK